MEERRGRLPQQHLEDKPRQFKRVMADNDGVISTWTYDLDVFNRGPILVENEYPKDWKSSEEEHIIDERDLPITKRTFLNQDTGKFVSYQRYKQLLKEGKII